MGCSNPHPHGQTWSLSEVPTLPATELASLARYAADPASPSAEGTPRGPNGKPCLLCEYAHFEVNSAEADGRIVVKNEHWVALVPWWATWPFEILRKYPSLLEKKCNTDLFSSRSAAVPPSHHLYRHAFSGREGIFRCDLVRGDEAL